MATFYNDAICFFSLNKSSTSQNVEPDFHSRASAGTHSQTEDKVNRKVYPQSHASPEVDLQKGADPTALFVYAKLIYMCICLCVETKRLNVSQMSLVPGCSSEPQKIKR